MGAKETARWLAQLLAPIEGVPLQVAGRGTTVLTVDDLLTRLRTFRHSDDAHHHGESVLQHISEVYDAVEELTVGWPKTRRDVLRMTALLHDVGKAYTHAIKNGRHTFYGHNLVSHAIAEHLVTAGAVSNKVLDLVLYHDIFFALANDRAAAKDVRYIRKFAARPLSQGEQLENLITFAKADSVHARAYRETVAGIETVLNDLTRYRTLQAQHEELLRRQQMYRRRNLIRYADEIATIAEAAVPGSARLLPDIKMLNKRLGQAKRFGTIKQIQAILSRGV